MKVEYKPRKIYRIRITHNYARKKVWYADKIGREYDAYLDSYGQDKTPHFRVGIGLIVNQLDCQVLSERVDGELK